MPWGMDLGFAFLLLVPESAAPVAPRLERHGARGEREQERGRRKRTSEPGMEDSDAEDASGSTRPGGAIIPWERGRRHTGGAGREVGSGIATPEARMGRRAMGLRLAGLALVTSLATPGAGAADEKGAPFRLAVIAPLSGRSPRPGRRRSSARGTPRAPRPGPSGRGASVRRSRRPGRGGEGVRAALTAKAAGVIAGGTGRTVDALAAKARRGRSPSCSWAAPGHRPR